MLTKLTSAGRSDLSVVGHDTSKQNLTWVEVATALSFAKVSRTEYLAALYAYAHDYSVQSELYYQLEVQAIELAIDWELTVRLFRRMFKLALAEALQPGVCATCHGTREFRTGPTSPAIPCKTCRATGRQVVDDHDRAKLLDMSYSNYRQHWRKRYEQLREWVDSKPRAVVEKLRL